MKKVFLIIAFLFAVVCYAAPPPETTAVPDPSVQVCQDAVQVEVIAIDQVFEAQEVAYIDIGNTAVNATQVNSEDLAGTLEQPCLVVAIEINENVKVNYKPPSDTQTKRATNNQSKKYRQNKQHSNYGYPFTGN